MNASSGVCTACLRKILEKMLIYSFDPKTPNNYSRDPRVWTFIDIETADMVVYLDNFYRSSKSPVFNITL